MKHTCVPVLTKHLGHPVFRERKPENNHPLGSATVVTLHMAHPVEAVFQGNDLL